MTLVANCLSGLKAFMSPDNAERGQPDRSISQQGLTRKAKNYHSYLHDLYSFCSGLDVFVGSLTAHHPVS